MSLFKIRFTWLILLTAIHVFLLWYFYYLPFTDAVFGKATFPDSSTFGGVLWYVSIVPTIFFMAIFDHLPGWFYNLFSIAVWLLVYWLLISVAFRLTNHSSGTPNGAP
ncbi:MAG: hypothetical protein K2V71_00720 [Methylotenera sp.]|nr:hypothetical protein [Methylotenera sp.]OQW69574.1 MAG: hypothetical protein BVN34_04485 [Proteobacteria bacterium ST_bin12]